MPSAAMFKLAEHLLNDALLSYPSKSLRQRIPIFDEVSTPKTRTIVLGLEE
jgi:hypothetical protein